MNKVYLVIEDWSYDCEFGTDIEIFDTKEKALNHLKERKEQILKENTYDIIEDEEESLSCYESCDYRFNHTDIYIREREVK